jgi:hypothetical protein
MQVKRDTCELTTDQFIDTDTITQNATRSTEPVDLEVCESEDGWIWLTCSSC